MTTTLDLQPYSEDFEQAVLDLTIETWEPVFPQMQADVPTFVYRAFYPEGWQDRQRADVAALLRDSSCQVWLAFNGNQLAGFVGFKLHPEDRMGEIVIIAVGPRFQRTGIATQLMTFAENSIRESGMDMVMVETVADGGHEPARRTYESRGYQTWPVARYFKNLAKG